MEDEVLASLVDYAESQASYLLGYLKEESKNEQIYLWDANDVIKLDQRPITAISSITSQESASSGASTVSSNCYRSLLKEGLIIFDQAIPENYTINVTYTRGWNQTTVPDIVKVFLCALVIQHYYSLFPGVQSTSQTIISKKIGAVEIKYSNADPKSSKSLSAWIDELATLIKSGSTLPDAV
jgi:hypothetical protein